MKLNELSPQQLAQLYRQELTSAFPPEELKPLRSMLSLMEQGRYQALGLYDGEDLVAYALIWLELRRVRLRPVRRPLPGPDPWGGGCDG